jgi:hypothetical protein
MPSRIIDPNRLQNLGLVRFREINLDIVACATPIVACEDSKPGDVLNPFEVKLREVLAFQQRLNNKVSVLVGLSAPDRGSATFLATLCEEN